LSFSLALNLSGVCLLRSSRVTEGVSASGRGQF